jgi:acyl carrier protein
MDRTFNPSSDALAEELVGLIRERLLDTRPGFDADSDLYEHGLDSMALMQLLVLVESKYGVVIDESRVTADAFRTARRIAQLIVAEGLLPENS